MTSIYFSAQLPLLLLIFALVGIILLLLFKKPDGSIMSSFTNLTGGGSSILSRYSDDLTAKASAGRLDPVIGRKEEIERVIQVLSRRNKNNPVLIGKPGVGKTAIAEGLAQAIVDKKVPRLLLDKKVLVLDLPGIIAGTKYRGEFEQRLKSIVEELKSLDRKIILFIDEIHSLAEAGEATGGLDADDILKPALARGELQVVGATTVKEYQDYIKNDPTLDRRLHPIIVDEPSKQEAVEILKGIKTRYEQFHKVKISDKAIAAAVELSAKYIKDSSFPDKAIDIMDEASAKVNISKINNKRGKNSLPTVGVAEVKEVIKEWQIDHKPSRPSRKKAK